MIDQIVIFNQNSYDIKISNIKKHFKSEFCSVLELSQKKTADQLTIAALESLILLCIYQCKDHLLPEEHVG